MIDIARSTLIELVCFSSREYPETSATERSQDVEVPAIKGHDRSRSVTLGQDHVRSVCDADGLTGIPLDHGARLNELVDIDPRVDPV